MSQRLRLCAYFLFSLGLLAPAAHAQAALPAYTRQDVMIPMRDGVELHAAVLRPVHTTGSLPILMTRTPYGTDDATAADYPRQHAELAESGYLFVEEDIRGRYRSGGTFVMMRPLAPHHDARLYPKDVDESTDAYDTVAWLVSHLPGNNGRVGVFGVSYPGFLTMEAGVDAHPAVKAISPQAPMTDVWLGDDFFHNGAFRQTYGYDYGLGMESSKENAFATMPAGQDAYDFFLKAGSFAGAIGAASLPTWQAFLAHPAYDSYWQERAVERHPHHGAGAYAPGWRLLGPGRYVGSAAGIRHAARLRPARTGKAGARPMEPWRVAAL